MIEEPDNVPIQRLLRCGRTGRYLKGEGWTPDIAQATRFPTQAVAVVLCIERGLQNVELVLLGPGEQEVFTSRIR
jgi:hypothetical protein